MEERARRAGHPISRSMISAYMRGEVTTPPNRERVHAIASALDVSFEEVAAAVRESYHLKDVQASADDVQNQRAQAWLRLTGHRTDDEISELLLIVEQILRMRDMDGP